MEQDIFARLWEAHAHRLVGFLTYRTGDRAFAEELAAETYEHVVRSRRGFDPRNGTEKTWIYGIALELLRDHTGRPDLEERASERVVDHPDAIMRAMSDLSEEEREALALRYVAELTIPEIGRLTSQRSETIEERVHEALSKVRDVVPDP